MYNEFTIFKGVIRDSTSIMIAYGAFGTFFLLDEPPPTRKNGSVTANDRPLFLEENFSTFIDYSSSITRSTGINNRVFGCLTERFVTSLRWIVERCIPKVELHFCILQVLKRFVIFVLNMW